ncbi:hypothetical protein AAMO2058_000156600 [Amorphochlora amoebiformis]
MTSPLVERTKGLIDAYVQAEQLPGALVAIIEKGKKEPLLVYSTGWEEKKDGAEKEKGTGGGEKDIYRIFSMTKAIVSVGAMILVEEGKLDLDAPLSTYLPEFKTTLKLASGHPVSKQITTRHLLTHQAGFTYGFFGTGPVKDAYKKLKIATIDETFAISSKELTKRLLQAPLRYEPGSHFDYSLASDVLGYLIEVISGRTLGEYLKNRILNPLEMNDTDFYVPKEKVSRVRPIYFASGFSYTNKPTAGNYNTPTRGLGAKPVAESGGAGLFSTAEDYLKFMRMLMEYGTLNATTILKPETVKYMVGVNQLPKCGTIASHVVKGGYPNLTGKGWNLIGSILTDPKNAPGHQCSSLGEYGWGGYASTYFQIDPKKEIGYLFLTQLVPPSTWPIRAQLTYTIQSNYPPRH